MYPIVSWLVSWLVNTSCNLGFKVDQQTSVLSLRPCKCFDFHSTPQRIDLYSIVYERSVCDEVMVLFWFWHTLHNCLLTREKSFVTGRKHGHVKICANFLEEQQNNT